MEDDKDEIKDNENDNDIENDNSKSNDELRKQHEKMLEDDLKGIESKLTKQFLSDSKFTLNQLNDVMSDKTYSSVPKNTSKISKGQSKSLNKRCPDGTLPRKHKIDLLTRKLDEEYFKQVKQTDKIPKTSNKIYEELEYYKQKVNDIKQVNRDEELLRMQKENQEIEQKLNELKQQDNRELREKQENCKKLVEELNDLFNERKKDAAEKEKEREKAIEDIKKIKAEQERHKKEIKTLEGDKKRLEETLQNLEKDVASYNIYKQFIEEVNRKYSNDSTSQNDLYDNLKDKFEQLMKHESEIQQSIKESEEEKEKIKQEIQEMRRRNDRQSQNTRLQQLENEIKIYTDKNKQLELEIDSILKEKQKKDSETHQIKLSIFNLYDKVMKEDGKADKGDNFDMDADETHLCMKLDKINEKIMDLISIHKELEKSQNLNNK